MNARQTKKNLKRKIQKLESDNRLMKRIIEDHSGMLELYDLYNSPLFETRTTMHFIKYKAKEKVPLDYPYPCDERIIEKIKRLLVDKMLNVVKENTIFYVDKNWPVTVTATIYLGRKDDLDDKGENI